MSQSEKFYRDDLDLLKGFAIIAVVLYHMGISSCGYLGVDVFFAINGFLIMPKVIREVADGRFRYLSFSRETGRPTLAAPAAGFCLLSAGRLLGNAPR